MTTDDKAIVLGHPSYVWRAGQERRFVLLCRYVALDQATILDVGCGLGLYVQRFRDFSSAVYGIDIDDEKVRQAALVLPNIQQGSAEHLPYPDGMFDVILSHEVLEHLPDDRAAVHEAQRVLKIGGRLVIFVPNRFYPFETHGYYRGGCYHYGNIPLINYLPDRWRNKLCPHVRAYTSHSLRRLFEGLPGRIVVHRHIFAGYDNIIARSPNLGRLLRRVTYALEDTPFRVFGLSHFLVYEKTGL
jgi:SAM-dependent methyltransferase